MNYKETKSVVQTTIISSDDGRFTYEIRKDFSNIKGKTAVVIMLFPGTSYLDILKTDNTTQSLINHVQELGFSQLRLVNIFSKVCSARMSVKNIQPDLEDLHYIENIMKEEGADSLEWIIAWGSSMSSSKVANQMKKQIIQRLKKHLPQVTLKQFMVEELDDVKNTAALHPLYLKIRYANSHWILEDYQVPKEMLIADEKEETKQSDNKNSNDSEEQSNQEQGLADKVKRQVKGNPKYIIQD